MATPIVTGKETYSCNDVMMPTLKSCTRVVWPRTPTYVPRSLRMRGADASSRLRNPRLFCNAFCALFEEFDPLIYFHLAVRKPRRISRGKRGCSR